MDTKPYSDDFEIADITKKDEEVIKQAENMIKRETGKDIVMIAWEKKIH